MKKCNKCQKILPKSAFYKCHLWKDGLYYTCKICHNARTKIYRENNHKKVLQMCKNWRDDINNKEKQKIHARNFRKKNPAYNQQCKRIHRALKIGNGGRHTETEWQILLVKNKFKCKSCGKKVKLTRDHIMPLKQGGTDDISNIQPLCQPCNSSKWALTMEQWKHYKKTNGGFL